MKKPLSILFICFVALSCDSNSDLNINPDSIIGFWKRETVYLNGINSNEYVDFLNGGNFLELKNDKTFSRAYDNGAWNLSNQTLKLERSVTSGFGDWSYRIVRYDQNSLTLELKLTEGQYCCGFKEFSDDEIITIQEVYKKHN